jgi:hypothetical protein
MVNESFFTLACAGLIGIMFGLTLCFAGYRFFLVLLPIFGFFFGLILGAQTLQAIGAGNFPFLLSITSWVVGFIVGGIFAVLSYLFYIAAVAIIAGALGYSVVVGLLLAIGLPMGFLVWLIGLVVGVLLAIVTIRFNIQKYVIIIATAVLGAEMIIGAIVLMFNPAAQVLANPVKAVLNASPLAAILALVVAVLGVIAQIKQNQSFTIDSYDRWESAA